MMVIVGREKSITRTVVESKPKAVMLTYRKIFLMAFALGYFPPISVFATDAPTPLSTIVRQVIARDDANQKALQSMEYHETLRIERLDGHGQVTRQQELRMIVRPGTTQEVQVLSEKGDDLPANPDEASLQAQGKEAQKKKVSFALKDMANRFDLILKGTDSIQGQPVYVVAFEPKPGQPYRDQTEKVLNHLRGRIWISTRDYSVLKITAHLAEPVEIAWIFAHINALDFHYELNNTSGGMGPARIQTSVRVDAPFLTIRQRMTVDMAQFQQRTKT